MDFVRWNAAAGRGQLDKGGLITADSSNAFMEFFFAGFERLTGTMIEAELKSHVYRLTKTALVDQNVVVNKHREKFLFTKAEWQRFNHSVWTIDDDNFKHERMRVQLLLLISIYVTTGARIGAFFANRSNPKHPGLLYKDISVVLKRADNGYKMIYKIDQRWVKNNRDPENIKFGSATQQHTVPLYDDTQFILALAIADNAFAKVDSVQALFALQIPPWEGNNALAMA